MYYKIVAYNTDTDTDTDTNTNTNIDTDSDTNTNSTFVNKLKQFITMAPLNNNTLPYNTL